MEFGVEWLVVVVIVVPVFVAFVAVVVWIVIVGMGIIRDVTDAAAIAAALALRASEIRIYISQVRKSILALALVLLSVRVVLVLAFGTVEVVLVNSR